MADSTELLIKSEANIKPRKSKRRPKRRTLHQDLQFKDPDCSMIINSISIQKNEAIIPDATGKRHKGARRGNIHRIMLRPTNKPKAPENSTQFIIDNHEGSSLFWNFENSTRQGSDSVPGSRVPLQDPYQNELEEFNVMWTQLGNQIQNQKEQHSKHKMLQRWNKSTLISEIVRLEKLAMMLEEELELRNPRAYISKLQIQLLQLQNENSYLKRTLASLKQRQ